MDKDMKRYLRQYSRELRVTTNENKFVTCILAVAMLLVVVEVWALTFDHFIIAGEAIAVFFALACLGIAARPIAERFTQ